MGRPTDLTPELQAEIVADIEAGAFPHVAARAAGIAPSTYYSWMARGREHADDDPIDAAELIFVEFMEAVTRARGKSRTKAERRVFNDDPLAWLKAGPGRDKADDEGWATTSKHEHTGAAGGPISSMDLSKLTPDELRAWHDLASKAEADGS